MYEWLDTALFYEIYPQSFYDTNSDGIGDLKGIIEKLDYIKETGFNAIWINPCFDSPFNDAGYDVRDYKKVAPRYGTNDDLKELFSEAHKRDMHVLLDLVPGHTSVEHEWFLESKKAERSELSDRYIWTNSIWESTIELPCIRGISDRDASCAVNFFSSQPALNYGNANPTMEYQMKPTDEAPLKTREAIKDVMRFWLDMGCDGFRVDMAGTLVKNDPDGSENIKLWQDFRRFLDEEYPEAVLVSEWGEPDKSIAGGFHMDFLLHFGPQCYNSLFRCDRPFFSKSGKGNIEIFAKEFQNFYNKADSKGLICIPSGNHDMDRLARGRDTDELKVCFAFLLSMPGAPFVYYGDEIGTQYLEGLTSVEGGYGRTGSRTPMSWDKTLPNDGFSSAGDKNLLYIKMNDTPNRPDVKSQLNDENSLLNEIKKLIKLRKSYRALENTGGYELIFAKENTYPFIYKRTSDDEEIYVLLNPSDSCRQCSVNNTDIAKGKIIYSLYCMGGKTEISEHNNLSDISVPPCSAVFFKANK